MIIQLLQPESAKATLELRIASGKSCQPERMKTDLCICSLISAPTIGVRAPLLLDTMGWNLPRLRASSTNRSWSSSCCTTKRAQGASAVRSHVSRLLFSQRQKGVHVESLLLCILCAAFKIITKCCDRISHNPTVFAKSWLPPKVVPPTK